MKKQLNRHFLAIVWFALALIATILSGCDTTFDRIAPPVWNTLGSSMDSVMIWKSIKLAGQARPAEFHLTNSETTRMIDRLEVSITGGDGELMVDGVPVENGGTFSTSGKTDIAILFTPTVTDPSEINIVLQAPGSGSSGTVATLVVRAFKNREPKAAFQIAAAASGTGSLMYSFDAARTLDPDSRWGDKVFQYDYVVTAPSGEQQAFTVLTPVCKFSFPDYGTYRVTLSAKDLDSDVSTVFSQTISVK